MDLLPRKRNVHIRKHTHFLFHPPGFTGFLKPNSGSFSTFLKVWPDRRALASQMQVPGLILNTNEWGSHVFARFGDHWPDPQHREVSFVLDVL